MERRMDRRDRERLAARQNHHQDHRVDLDSRTPLAWQHRDFNYQVPHTSSFNERYPEGAAPPSSGSDRFSHPAASVGSRSARSARHPAQSKSGNNSASSSGRPPASKKTSTSSSGTNNGGIAVGGNSNITVTPRTASAGSSSGGNRNSSVPGRHHHHLRGHHHPSRSSEETTTGGSASETETDAERGHQPSLGRPGTSGTLRSMQSMPLLSPLLHHQAAFNPMLGPPPGSIYGVLQPPPPPSMMTWNGEPCPVHGAGLHHHGMATLSGYPQPSAIYSSMASMRRAASIHELAALASTPIHPALMPPPPPPSAIYGTLPHHPQMMMQAEPMQHHFMMMAGPPPPHHHHPPGSLMGGTRMIRPMMRSGPASLPPMGRVNNGGGGRPIVVNGKNGQPEPLPVREAPPLPPKIAASDVMSMRAVSTKAGSGASGSSVKPFSYRACCQGNVVVLWVIMGIIGLGVVMAIVFYYAFK